MINKKEFAKAILDKVLKIFLFHVLALQALEIAIYPSEIAQIINVKPIQVASLK